MALSTRTINISLRLPTAATSATVKFIPDLAAGDGQVLLEETYTATVTASPAATTLTGSINLPVKTIGFIAYRVQFPRESGYNEHYIYVDAGSAVDLSYLLTLSEVAGATIALDDLTDVVITTPVAGEYLRYNGTEWVDSAIQAGDLPATVMLTSVYDTDTDGIVDRTKQVVMTVRNDTATTLTVGEVVYVSGASGEHVKVKRAQATTDGLSANTLGMVLESITSGADGLIALHGVVTGVNTNAYNEGDALYLSPSVAGGVTSTKTTAPDHLVFIGWVTKKSGNGKIALHIQNGYEIDELHDVLISTPSNDDLLVYEAGPPALWKNKSISTLGLALDANVVKLTSNQTVTGVKTFSDDLVGTSGASISGTVSVGSNSPTLALKAASSTPSLGLTASRGTLSSPTGIVSGDTLGQLNFFGYSDAFANYVRPAHIWAVATATFDDLPHSTAIQFGTANTGSSSLQRMTLHSPGNLTIGENSDLSVRLVTRSTTEQFRAMYDGSNYASLTVSSSGATTFNAVGSGASFTFSDPVYISSGNIYGTTVVFDAGDLVLVDPFSSYQAYISLASNSILDDRTLTINLNDGNRTLSLTGNATISGTNTGDQTITLSGAVTGSGTGAISTTLASGIDATKIADGSVSNTEFQYLNGVSSAIQTQLDGKVDENGAITGATKTKITYDSKGLVTAGADATTADIADSSNKRYVTDADLTKLSNLSGTNSGDQNVFPNIKVGATTITANTTTDTLEFIAGSNITLTPSGDTITIAATSGGALDGSGSANKLAIWSDADTLTFDSNLSWDTPNETLTIFSNYSGTDNEFYFGGGDFYVGFADLMIGLSKANSEIYLEGYTRITNTTEQLRLRYDASNYFSTTVGATGTVTLNATGSGAKFVFSDAVEVPDDAYASGWNGSTAVPTKNAVYDKIQTIGVRVTAATNSDTAPTPNADTTDIYTFTALSVAPTFGAPTGTPVNGQKLIIRIKDNGTARALNWNAAYVAGGASLPTTTVINKTMHLGFIYNTDNSLNKWMLIAKSEEA